jgi:hypothetical protein
MEKQQFLDVLKNKNIPFEINNGKVKVFGGYVYLRSLTDGIKDCGNQKRNVRPFVQKGEWRVQLGCFNGNKEQAIEAIRKKYGNNSDYEAKIIQAFQKFGQ